jgi:mRNA interferase HigB
MRVITFRQFAIFAKKHPDSRGQLEMLRRELKRELFENANQVKDHFPYVSILSDSRVVFNIGGNKYRLILKFNFNTGIAYVRFIGTHLEYDRIDADNI